MKAQVPDKVRVALSRRYLDWAERLTWIHGSFDELRRIRQRQHAEADEVYIRTRPIEGSELQLLYFRQMEVFHLEDIDRLRNGVLRLFPELDDPWQFGHFSIDLKRQIGKLGVAAWWNLGVVVRDRKGRIFGGRIRTIGELPVEVDYVQVKLHAVLPSLFVVVLDVHLTDLATQALNQLQSRRYLSEIRLRRLLPMGAKYVGFMEVTADKVMCREITDWLEHLRGEVEECLRPYVGGYFSRYSASGVARLPATEVYAMTGVPSEKDDLSSWLDKARWWSDTIGLDIHTFNTYSDGRLLIAPSWHTVNSIPDHGRPHQIVILQEPYAESINIEMFHGDVGQAIKYHSQEGMLDALLPGLIISELLRVSEGEIAGLRQAAFRHMRRRWLVGFRMRTYIRLNDAILQASMLLDRVSVEYEQWQEWFQLEIKEAGDLPLLDKLRPEKIQNLSEDLMELIAHRTKLLHTHVALTKDWLSQYLALRNTAAMYWLALIAGVLSIVGIVGWVDMQRFIKSIAAFVLGLFH